MTEHIHEWTRDNLFLVRRLTIIERDPKSGNLICVGHKSSVETTGAYSPPEIEYCAAPGCGLVRIIQAPATAAAP